MGGKETRDSTEETCQLYTAVIFGPGSSASRQTLWFDVTFLISGHTDDSEEIEQHGVGLRFKYSS